MKQNRILHRAACLALALSLLLTSCGGGNEAAATTMRLQKTQGTVGVSDGGGTSVEPREGLGLYSGYGVGTERSSYAWVDLDEVKLTKLDENSEIKIKKEGKQLEIEVKSGSLFFNVTEPLAADETLDIRSSTMVVGIRGTCGWVTQGAVALLEGTVEVTAGDQTVTVTAGEMAVLTADGGLEVQKLSAGDIPAFVREEVEDDEELLAAVGGETPNGPGGGPDSGDLADYADILDRIRADGEEVLYTEILDFEGDGKPELLAIVNTPAYGEYITIRVYRKGMTEGYLAISSVEYPVIHGIGIVSLVEYGGRLFIKRQIIQPFPETSPEAFQAETSYYGSVAREEGLIGDWGYVDVFECGSNDTSGDRYARRLHDERGLAASGEEKLTAEEFADAQAQYKELKVLAYHTSEEGYILLPDPSEIGEGAPSPEPSAEPSTAPPPEPSAEPSPEPSTAPSPEPSPEPSPAQSPEPPAQESEAITELPAEFVGEYAPASASYFSVIFSADGKCNGAGDNPGSGPYNHYLSKPQSMARNADGTVVITFSYCTYTFYPTGHGSSQYPNNIALEFVTTQPSGSSSTKWYYK